MTDMTAMMAQYLDPVRVKVDCHKKLTVCPFVCPNVKGVTMSSILINPAEQKFIDSYE